jgi:hypothetical protein
LMTLRANRGADGVGLELQHGAGASGV